MAAKTQVSYFNKEVLENDSGIYYRPPDQVCEFYKFAIVWSTSWMKQSFSLIQQSVNMQLKNPNKTPFPLQNLIVYTLHVMLKQN